MAVTDRNSLVASYLMGRDQLTSRPGCYVLSSEEAITKAKESPSSRLKEAGPAPREGGLAFVHPCRNLRGLQTGIYESGSGVSQSP